MGSREWRCCSDAQGRFYHPITNLPRELRPFLSFSGEKLFGVDVSASHPCLLSRLYKNDCEEKARYVQLVQSGAFYARLNALQPHPRDLRDDGEKSALKEEVFHRVFYGSAYSNPSPIGEAFAGEFPILAGLVKHEKRRHQRDLANTLQKWEAEIVIDQTASMVAQKYPRHDICLVSVHDCFFTTQEFCGEVAELLASEYARFTGFRPSVQIQGLSTAYGCPIQVERLATSRAMPEKSLVEVH